MSTSQQADPMIGRLVDGRYRVRARIARGGMATVYVATDLRLERRVALKVMHGHLTDDAVFQSRFIQEARAAARLADPNVVNVFDQGQDEGLAYLVMEYLPGITLRELLREQRRLTVPQTIAIMDATLSGLAAAHRAGIVHRDVKPENILLAEDGRIKIGDFGLARATTANTATGQMLLGTIAYLAPELVTRGSADARSDIYALGIMLYEMLTGEQPYQGEQPMQIAYQHANDSVPRPSAKNAQVPEPLDELVLWATERDPDERPLDAQQMLERLREIEHDLGIAPARVQTTGAIPVVDSHGSGELTAVLPSGATTTITAPEPVDNAARLRRRTARRRARGAWLTVLIILLTALAAGAGWWFGSGPGSQVVVTDVTGQSFDDASAQLARDSLVAVPGDGVYSTDVAEDLVVSTDPGPGARVDKDTDVVVVLSLGPKPTTLDPGLAGQSEDEVRVLLTNAGVEVGDGSTQFADAEAGTVLAATRHPADGSDAVDVSETGAVVYDGDTVTLVVSLGAVPSVVGMSVEDATAALSAVDLSVASTSEEYNDDYPAGQVYAIGERDGGGNWRPGDAVPLLVSKGPQPFPIPGVQDLTRDEAVARLKDAGFKVDFAPIWIPFPNGLTRVVGTDPAEGSERPLGTVVYLQITASA